jgi:hypothetical protein
MNYKSKIYIETSRFKNNTLTELRDIIENKNNSVGVFYGSIHEETQDIHLSHVSHTIRNDINGGFIFQILNTQYGKIIKELIKDGLPIYPIVQYIDTGTHKDKFLTINMSADIPEGYVIADLQILRENKLKRILK